MSEDPQGSLLPTIYQTYLCREPAGDVPLLINNGPDEYTALLRTLQRSADHYAEKDQTRSVERLQLEIARLHMQHQQWQRAMRTLIPLWQTLTWRQTGWWKLLEGVDRALQECAIAVGDRETLIAVNWELNSLTARQESSTDIGRSLKDISGASSNRPRSVLRSESILSYVSASFAFANVEGNVGEPLDAQLVLRLTSPWAKPISIGQIRIAFRGGLKAMTIRHAAAEKHNDDDDDDERSDSVSIQEVAMSSHQNLPSNDDSSSVASTASHSAVGSSDLLLHPRRTTVLSLTNVPREAGEVEISNVTLYIKDDDFDLELIISDGEQLQADHFWISSPSGVSKKPLKGGRSSAVKILPKPPKVQIGLLDALSSYYVDEAVTFDMEIANDEPEAVLGTLDVRLQGAPGPPPQLAWNTTSAAEDVLAETPAQFAAVDDGYLKLPPKSLDIMEHSARQRHSIVIKSVTSPVEYSLQISVRYSLKSDPETFIIKTFTTDLVFVQPLEASFTYAPLVHPDAWPNYFDIAQPDPETNSEETKASGLTQRWQLTSRLTSLADSPFTIESIKPVVAQVEGAAVCRILSTESTTPPDSHSQLLSVPPGILQEHKYDLDVQKLDLEDRRPCTVDLRLEIKYHRADTHSKTITTSLPIPHLAIPFGEPRVLASASSTAASTAPSSSSSSSSTSQQQHQQPKQQIITLNYTLENPSLFTLTFNLSMDPSDDFAFAGPKNITVQHLLPLSRHMITFRLLPLVALPKKSGKGEEKERDKGKWITPVLRVYDVGFRKELRVLAAASPAIVESGGGREGREVGRNILRSDKRGGASGGGGGGGGVAVWVDAVE